MRNLRLSQPVLQRLEWSYRRPTLRTPGGISSSPTCCRQCIHDRSRFFFFSRFSSLPQWFCRHVRSTDIIIAAVAAADSHLTEREEGEGKEESHPEMKLPDSTARSRLPQFTTTTTLPGNRFCLRFSRTRFFGEAKLFPRVVRDAGAFP